MTLLIANDREVLLQAHELAQLGTWVWDVRADEVHWSEELYRLFGIAPQTAPLRLDSFIRFVHPEDREQVSMTLSFSAASGAPFDHDFRVINSRGQVRFINGRGSVVMDASGRSERLIGTTLDITDRDQAEAALRRSEERFRSVFEQTLTGIAIFDGECALSQVNAAFATFLGYKQADLVGKRLEEITHMEDHPVLNPCYRTTFTSDARYMTKEGGIVWGRTCLTPLTGNHGQRVGYMAVVEDITEKRRAHEALMRQVEVMRAVLDHMPLMVVMVDSRGRALFVNREFERVFGWSAAEATEMDLFSAAFPDAVERARVLEGVRRAAASWKDNAPVNRYGLRVRSSWRCLGLPDATTICIGREPSADAHVGEAGAQAVSAVEAVGAMVSRTTLTS